MGRILYIEDFEKWKQEFHFYHSVTVRFSEIDMFGHLNNTIPFIYFESARIEFFQDLGFMQDWVLPESETIPVVADLQCDFLKQVFLGEPLKIYVKANTVGHTSVDLHYMGKMEDGSICFVGRGTMVQISKKTGKSITWTDRMRQLLMNNISVK